MSAKIATAVLLLTLSMWVVAFGSDSPDPYGSAWSIYVESLNTLEARFTVIDQIKNKTREYFVRLDRRDGLFYGKKLVASRNLEGPVTYEDEHGYNGSLLWMSTATPDGKGGRRFDYESPVAATGAIPLEGRRSQVGITKLEEVLLPFHLSQTVRSKFVVEYAPGESAPSRQAGKTTLGYLLKEKSTAEQPLFGKIVYVVDFSDGVHIYDTKIYQRQSDDKSLLLYQQRSEDFAKSREGVWFPKKTTMTEYDEKGAVTEQYTLLLLELAVNKPFRKEDFAPAPRKGDGIWDAIANTQYIYGSVPSDVRPEAADLLKKPASGNSNSLPGDAKPRINGKEIASTKTTMVVENKGNTGTGETATARQKSSDSPVKFLTWFGGALLLFLLLFLGFALAKSRKGAKYPK